MIIYATYYLLYYFRERDFIHKTEYVVHIWMKGEHKGAVVCIKIDR